MKKEQLEYINKRIENAKEMEYDYVVELLSKVKHAINEDNKEDMISVLWELVDYIAIY